MSEPLTLPEPPDEDAEELDWLIAHIPEAAEYWEDNDERH